MTTVADTKRCTQCDTVKPIAEFRQRGDSDSGALSSWCRSCHSDAATAEREERRRADALTVAAPPPPGWHHQAACRGQDGDLWFADTTSPADKVATRYAKGVCATCPVRTPCRDHALSQPRSIAGVWGGLDEGDRRSIKRSEARRRAKTT